MTNQKTSQIAAIYDSRSAQYDQSFHPRLAADLIKWAELKPGQKVLDLCCGTGLVALLAKQAVGFHGKVIGRCFRCVHCPNAYSLPQRKAWRLGFIAILAFVFLSVVTVRENADSEFTTGIDISEQMMNEGRRKAADSGLEVDFRYGEVAKLAREELLSPEMEGFDLVTCASGIVLLDNPDAAVKHWSTLLAPSGKLIFDVPVQEALLGGSVMEDVLQSAGLSSELVYNRKWVTSVEELRKAVSGADLEPTSVFETESYCTNDYDASETLGHFEKLIKYSKAGDSADREVRARMKDLFEERMRLRAGKSGKISEDVRFFMAIATKRG